LARTMDLSIDARRQVTGDVIDRAR